VSISEFHFTGDPVATKFEICLSKWAGIRKPSKLRGEHTIPRRFELLPHALIEIAQTGKPIVGRSHFFSHVAKRSRPEFPSPARRTFQVVPDFVRPLEWIIRPKRLNTE